MHSQLHTSYTYIYINKCVRTSTFLSYKRLLSLHGLSSAMTKEMAENPSLLKGKFLCQKDTLPFRIFRLVEMKRNKNSACKTAFCLSLILDPFATFCFVVAAAMGPEKQRCYIGGC